MMALVKIPKDIPALVSALNEHLSAGIVGLITGVRYEDAEMVITAWSEGRATPDKKQIGKLQLAYEIFFALGLRRGPSTAVALFTTGSKPSLGNRSYLEAIHCGIDDNKIRAAAEQDMKTK